MTGAGRDSRLTDEMIEATARATFAASYEGGVCPRWDALPERARHGYRRRAGIALTAALSLLPSDAEVRADERAKIAATWAEHWHNRRDGNAYGFNWHSGCNGCLDFDRALARGSAAATEDAQ